MKKAVVIVGPTAVGKTSLALKIAKHFNVEIVSVDSVQLFKGLDIISGKDKDELLEVSSHLLDVISPAESFSVSQFQKLAKKTVFNISENNKLPIIVGGTGLYVKSIIDGVDTSNIRPNQKLRDQLERLTVENLQEKLKSLDRKTWEAMNESDSKNKRRLIRKIEILLSSKQKVESSKQGDIEFLQIGLELPRDELKEKIDTRVDERIKIGAIEEAEGLFQNYSSLTQQVKDANGYKQLFEYLQGKVSRKQAIEKWRLSEYKHAKNQMTWFKKDMRIKWFRADEKNLFESVMKTIDTFLMG